MWVLHITFCCHYSGRHAHGVLRQCVLELTKLTHLTIPSEDEAPEMQYSPPVPSVKLSLSPFLSVLYAEIASMYHDSVHVFWGGNSDSQKA